MTSATGNCQRFIDFTGGSVAVARELLGRRLVRIVDGRRLAGTIVEVEAYLGVEDRAAHSYGGRRTDRTEAMYLPGGHAYVYFIYGMHHCLNVVCGCRDEPIAVLIRALAPTEGLDVMRSRRPRARRDVDLCSGPGKLAQAMAVDRSFNGASLIDGPELFIERAGDRLDDAHVVAGPRVGVGYAGDWAHKALRFCVGDMREFCSRKGLR